MVRILGVICYALNYIKTDTLFFLYNIIIMYTITASVIHFFKLHLSRRDISLPDVQL